jgi:hypothetical protein
VKLAQVKNMKLVRLWPLAVGGLISGVVSIVVATSGTAAGVGPTIAGEPEARLSMHGIRLLVADRQATITEAQALQVARQTLGSEFASPPGVRQVQLARVVRSAPSLDAVCWIVSFDPSGFRQVLGPPLPAGSTKVQPGAIPTVAFYTVYIDATTGAWLFSEAGN